MSPLRGKVAGGAAPGGGWPRLVVACTVALWVAACGGDGSEALRKLESGEERERAAAVEALARRPTLFDAVAMQNAAADGSPVVRLAVARAATERGDAPSVGLLAGLTDDRDPATRAAALQGLLRHVDRADARGHLLAAYARHGLAEREAIVAALVEEGGSFEEVVRHEAAALWERNLQGMEAGGLAELVGALEELGRSGRGEAVERLGSLLGSASFRICLAAARGLGASKDPAARPWLEALLDADTPARRSVAAEALGALGDPAAIPALAQAAKRWGDEGLLAARALVELDAPADVACAAAQEAENARAAGWLARHVAEAGATCALPELEDGPPRGRRFFAWAQLSKELRLREAVEPLLAVATDEDETTDRRLAAYEALGGIGGAAVATALAPHFEAAAASLAEGRETWVEGPLPRTWAEGFEPEGEAPPQGKGAPALHESVDAEQILLFAALAHAAADAGVEGARGAMASLVEDPAPEVRTVAVRGAGLEPETLAKIAAEDPSWEVRKEAVRALGALEEDGVAERLAALAEGPQELRQVAVEALEARKEGEALRALYQRSQAPELAAALGRLGDPVAAKALLRGEVAGAVTPAWIASLRHVRSADATRAVRRFLHHDRAEIRAAAAAVLGERCDAPSLPMLRALAAEDYHVEVRHAAQGAVASLAGEGCGR